jgi:hypothetical protein
MALTLLNMNLRCSWRWKQREREQAMEMSKNILTVTGALLILAGVLGFGVPALFSMHLNLVHNLIHIVSGCLALFYALKGTLVSIRTFSIIFGEIYALLGLIGLFTGGAHGLLVIIPNQLVLGAADHIVHIALGGTLLWAAFSNSDSVAPPQR